MTLQKDTRDKLVKAARNCQQNFYELLSDWNSYDRKKPQYLKNFIGTALFGPPQINQDNTSCLFEKQLEDVIFFQDSHQQQTIDKIYEKILQHGTQNKGKHEIMCGLIYNVIFDISIECGKYFTEEHVIKCLQPIPIFKVLKNFVKRTNSGNLITTKLEIHYIDDCGRVYKSWKDYLNFNILPKCFMVVPKAGEYQADYSNQWSENISYVSIEMYKSPSCFNESISRIDSINKFVGLGCAGFGLAAAFNPVGGALMTLGAVGMGLSGLWSMGRNSQIIADRHLHEQSIGMKDKDGIVRWFGLASSILTVATSGGSMLLSNAVKNATTLSTAAKIVHSSAQIGSIAASGVNVGLIINNINDSNQKYVSAQDTLNLVSNLLLFTNSIVNLQFANSILRKNQTELIHDFENSLRIARHRKEFRRMVKNSTSLPSYQTPEQIRSTTKITTKNHLTYSKNNFQIKDDFLFTGIVSSDGIISIDGKNLIKPLDFVKKLKEQKNRPINIALTTNYSISNNIFEKVLKNFLLRYKNEFTNSQLSLTLFSSFLNNISEIDKPDVIFSKLLLIGIKLVKNMNRNLFTTCRKYLISNAISETVDFLWEFIQVNLREKIGLCRQSEDYRELIMKIIIGIHSSVRNNIDEWIDSLKYYLLIKNEWMRRKIENDDGKVYLLQVM
ncbi:uncharacterized protein LOC122500873 [Leptopilina heterotoma]|uniref:uncharacterized protein LOC122500873 n=1 Tax=Leptopilina heterotoma TaxID=63436 RepID=UPI001CA8D712|nr:uncharacterized protein LOC122500873 [Leptopilina heterotoma]